MKGFKKCENGHFYKDSLAVCPHCPGGSIANSGQSRNFDRTVAEGTGSGVENTVFEGELDKTVVMGGSMDDLGSSVSTESIDLSKTYIIVDNSGDQESGEILTPRKNRMLVGWLVSYTVDKMGRDYRIYEGRNTIGTRASNDIVVVSDPSVSGHHSTILFRGNKYYIKDELSSNGTKLNGIDLIPSEIPELEDGSIITVGDTVFKFRTSF